MCEQKGRFCRPATVFTYSEEGGTYCSELMGVVKPFISRALDPAVFWRVFLVSVTKSVHNTMRSKATRGKKRTAKVSHRVRLLCAS